MAVKTINQHDTTELTDLNDINILVEDKDLTGTDEKHEKANLGGLGLYKKPSGGIPKTDLDSTVQTSLGKADNAQPKETGKGLSTNDYDDTEKGKVASAKQTADAIAQAYLKTATLSADNKTLTLTKQDGFTVNFQGGNDVNLSVVNGKLCITYTE